MNQGMLNLEEQVMEKANFLYICKYNGKEHIRSCIREALFEITKLNEVQVCNLFGVYKKDLGIVDFDFEQCIDKIYNKMQEMGAGQ